MSLNQLINHHYLLLDKSTSMRPIIQKAGEVADRYVRELAPLSEDANQEVRVTALAFGTPRNQKLDAFCYDRDVTRTPVIGSVWKAVDDSTGIYDAVDRAIDVGLAFPEDYGNHAHVLTLITDGEHNDPRSISFAPLRAKIKGLPANWTITAMMPSSWASEWAERELGLWPDNITTWQTTREGVERVGTVLRQATQSYMTARSLGQTQVSNYFSPDVTNFAVNASSAIASGDVKELPGGTYEMFGVVAKEPIKDFVERQAGRPYATGSAYYQHTKRETIQPQKRIVARDKLSGTLYVGDGVRRLLGIPYTHTMVDPARHDRYDIFVQSTSVNRNLIPGQSVIVLR